MGLGEQYELEKFGRIFPENHEPNKERKMEPKQYNFFWSGPYSQWDPTPFQVGQVKFSCAEQMMMLFKAIVFNDVENAKNIMATNDPQKQKAFGRKVKGFLPSVWERYDYSVVYVANVEKFSQNPEHFQYMVTDGSDMIVEASPEDKIWGIGMGANHPDIRDESKWQGENKLGKVCMEVRDFLRNPSQFMDVHEKHNEIVINLMIEKAELLEQLYK